MAWSKESRIKFFIAIDFLFFAIELVIGYWAHSLALVADAFHMLNDVISLFVGLWAVKVATAKQTDTFTYGWARAETLGGLVNGVFLVALCMTIFLEAIQRFFEPQQVSNPVSVLIVGGIGLVFNILGLFVFHQPHGHDHSHDEVDTAEQGHGHGHVHDDHDHAHTHSEQEPLLASYKNGSSPKPIINSDSTFPNHNRNNSRASHASVGNFARRGGSRSFHEDLVVHPEYIRGAIRAQARMSEDDVDESESDGEAVEAVPSEETNLSANGKHHGHHHTKPLPASKSHGHNHADMNMRGMFLHVVGDALGNVGVMASALIIWRATGDWRFYSDPLISMLITLIILKSAVPLIRDTAKPLLQAVPEGIEVDKIKEDIEQLEGVRSVHHIHVWALTPTKRIATLDVDMNFVYEVEKYMRLAKDIKECLHGFGIHSSTIQPEFSDTGNSCQLDCGHAEDSSVLCCPLGDASSTKQSTEGDSEDPHSPSDGHFGLSH